MAFLRFALLMLAVQTLVYVSLYFYLRASRRERLVREFNPSATEREREAFVTAALATYCSRMSRWLAVAVYAVPVIGLAVFIYVTNLR